MEKSVRDREEKRWLQDFESTESLKSRFKDIGFAFKSCGKLKDVSFDQKLQSRRIDLSRGFQPCGKLKDVSFHEKRESRRIASGFQPCGKLKDVSFDKKRSRRSEIERFKWEERMSELVKSERNRTSELFKSEECETPPPESCKTEIDEEASQEESWIQESWNKIGERSGSEIDKRESWKSEIDGDIDKCESLKSQIDGDSDNERLYHTFGRWLDRVQVDSEEDSDKEGLYQSFGCWVDADEEIPAGMPRVTWRSDLYNDNDPVNYKKMGRVFKHWRFRVIWGRDGCYPSSGEKMRLVYSCPSKRQEMALIYLKWIAKVLGSKQQALDSLVSFTKTYFICQGISFDQAHLFKRFVNIYCVYPVINETDVHGFDTKEMLLSFTDEKEKVFCRCKLNEEWLEDPRAISPRYNRYWRGYKRM